MYCTLYQDLLPLHRNVGVTANKRKKDLQPDRTGRASI